MFCFFLQGLPPGMSSIFTDRSHPAGGGAYARADSYPADGNSAPSSYANGVRHDGFAPGQQNGYQSAYQNGHGNGVQYFRHSSQVHCNLLSANTLLSEMV